jgi:hypothetical protein
MADIDFDEMCRTLGYEPASVLSIRINARRIVVTYADPAGDLHTAVSGAPGRPGESAEDRSRKTPGGDAPG